MKQYLEKFIEKIENETFDLISDNTTIIELKKDDYLLTEGKNANIYGS